MSTYLVMLEMTEHRDVIKEHTVNASTFDIAKERAELANPGFTAFRVIASNGYTDYETRD
jgi:hypothetical protein